jgi:YVTN family beta-propeller protein
MNRVNSNQDHSCNDKMLFIVPVVALLTLLALVLTTGQPAQAKTGTVVANIPVCCYPFGGVYDPANNQVYVANTNSDILSPTFTNSSGSVSAIDTYNVVRTIPVGNDPIGVAYDSATNRIYVSNTGSQSVSVINGTIDTLIGTPIPVQIFPWGIAYDSVNKHM